MKKYFRKSVSTELKKFDYLAQTDDFIEVTEWHNGEGWDITINDRKISLTDGELKAINHLIREIDITSKDEYGN